MIPLLQSFALDTLIDSFKPQQYRPNGSHPRVAIRVMEGRYAKLMRSRRLGVT